MYSFKTVNNSLVPKARLVARGFEEYSQDIQKDSPTCAHESFRLIISVLAQNKWKLNSMDIKTAFLQGQPIDRDVYIKPPVEARVCSNKVWKLDKCVYGLSDASLNWYCRVKSLLLELGASVSKVDPAVFYWIDSHGDVYGVLACHVDDFIWGGKPEFENVVSKIRSILQVGKESNQAFKYCGIDLEHNNDNKTYLHQDSYTDSLKPIEITAARALEKDSELTESEKHSVRCKVGQLLWLAHQSRPDLLFDVTSVSNNINRATVQHVLEINKIIGKAKVTKSSLKFQNLGSKNELKLVVFSDASLGNMPNGGSQGGYLVLLVGESGKFSPIWWNSKKIRRVVRSTLAAETLALAEGIDNGIFLCTLLAELMYGKSDPTTFPIECYTDCKSLYEALKSAKSVSEKRLRLDISSITELLETKQITSVSWCDTDKQLADSLTKKGASPKILRNTLESGLLFDMFVKKEYSGIF